MNFYVYIHVQHSQNKKTYIMYDRYISSLFYPVDERLSLILKRCTFRYMSLQSRNQIKLTKNPVISLESELSTLK